MDETTPDRILLVEDNPADVETIRRVLDRSERNIELETITDGARAGDLLSNPGAREELVRPDLIFLDLNLPGTDGRELIRRLDDSESWEIVPIVVLTTSNNTDDIDHAYRHGANAYVVKPGPHDEFVRTIEAICDFWL